MKKFLWSERIKNAPRFFSIEPYLRQQDKPVSSHPEAREPRIVPLVILDYGSVRSRLKQMRYEGLKEYFIGCAGHLSNPPGVLGVGTRTLALGPLSGSNLLGIDRTQ